jgi:hypothetical protein
VAADALSRLPVAEDEATNIEVMLNHPPQYLHDSLYNRYPLDLQLIADEQ